MRRVRVVSTPPNVTPGHFLLIAGEDGEPWCAAAQELAADTNVPLDAVRIGHLDGDLYDSRCAWLRHRQIHTDGAILVRPDRFIGWRAPSTAENPLAHIIHISNNPYGHDVWRLGEPPSAG